MEKEERQQKVKREINLPEDLLFDIKEALKPIKEEAEKKAERLKKY